tara:strand:+ start:8309 stop:8602 length:294 start_codon:yes stop_codon:yes gene_type:complete
MIKILEDFVDNVNASLRDTVGVTIAPIRGAVMAAAASVSVFAEQVGDSFSEMVSGGLGSISTESGAEAALGGTGFEWLAPVLAGLAVAVNRAREGKV